MSQSLEGKGVYGPLLRPPVDCGEMAVNSHSHSQLVSLNQTADAEPTTRVGPPGVRVPRGNQALTSAEDLSPKRHSL